MYYVYFIRSLKDNSVYVGSTANLTKRLRQHNLGQSTYTKSRIPYELVYYEAYIFKGASLIREKEIKKSWSKKEEILKRLI